MNSSSKRVDRLLVSVALRSDGTAPRRAREALGDFPELDGVRDDAALVVSELVTNAVEHSGAAHGDLITMSVFVDAERVRIQVHDPALTDLTPRLRERHSRQDGGLGLQLVNQLARRWDSENVDGRTVWADLLFPAALSGTSAATA